MHLTIVCSGGQDWRDRGGSPAVLMTVSSGCEGDVCKSCASKSALIAM